MHIFIILLTIHDDGSYYDIFTYAYNILSSCTSPVALLSPPLTVVSSTLIASPPQDSTNEW